MLDFFMEHLAEIVTIIVNIVVVIGSYYKVVNRLTMVEKQILDEEKLRKKDIEDIEKARVNNVVFLKEIYDAKIEDSKKYSKGLFEIREGELREISKQLSELKARVDHQTEILNKTLSELSVGMAELRTHVKSCPYYNRRLDMENEK